MVNRFSEDFLEKKIPELKDLKDWGENFWKIDQAKVKLTFAQKGYEDKGVGHSERIVSNVGDLLGKYFDVLCQLNHPGETAENKKKKFRNECFEYLKPHLILFYITAYLHDIGMNFAGIFEALSDLVAAGGDTALHIGEIIHNYHHYASFIVLFEIYYLDQNGTPKNQAKCPYFFNIRKNPPKENNPLEYMEDLKGKLRDIYENEDTLLKKFFELEEFFVVLAILCLLHMEVNWDYVQSILLKYKTQKKDERIRYFDKWRSKLDRALEWTEKLQEKISDREKNEIKFSGKEQVVVEIGRGPTIVFDLLFVEALLQYGDKTEVTIARLAREIKIKAPGKSKDRNIIPLKHFLEDTEYDNQKGFICTNMAQRIISSFARYRACRFIPLILVNVQEVKEEKKIQEELEVIFHYSRFDNDEDIFRILRYHNEKAFFDLGLLDVIKIHVPMLLDYWKEKPKKNPLFEIKFKKVDHRFVSLDEELKRLCDYFLQIAKKDKKEIRREVTSKESTESKPKIVITEPKNLLVDFFNTLEPEQIPIVKPDIKDEKKGDKFNLNEYLEVKFKNYLNRLENEIVFEGEDREDKKKSKRNLYVTLEELFHNYCSFIDLVKVIQKPVEKVNDGKEKEKTENLKIFLYKELKKGLVDFMVELKVVQIEEAVKMKQSKEDSHFILDDDLDKRLCEFRDTLTAKRILQESIYGGAVEKIDQIDRFPYTPQNRKAIFELSKSILDPEEKKKTEGTKKAFCKTCDLIVPSSFELMAVLNLFQEEE
jgi:hypothetical protein